MALNISVVVLTHNDASQIAACLESLTWCDEIIIVDDNSDDKTLDIAKRYHPTIYTHNLANNFALQRNFGLEKAQGTWVLFVDADEQVSLSLQYEILNNINDTFQTFDAFYVRRIDEIWGKKLRHGEMGNIKLLRLAKRESGKWQRKVHEVWKVKGKIGELQNPIIHHPHQTIREFISEINHYTNIRVEELYEKKVSVFWGTIILYPLGKFIVSYLFKRGFLDGIPGLVAALLMAFHSFLVRAKLWTMYPHAEK